MSEIREFINSAQEKDVEKLIHKIAVLQNKLNSLTVKDKKIINDGKICRTCDHYDNQYYVCANRNRDTGEEQWCDEWREKQEALTVEDEPFRNHHRGICFKVEDEGNKPQWSLNPHMTDNQIVLRKIEEFRKYYKALLESWKARAKHKGVLIDERVVNTVLNELVGWLQPED